MDGAARAAPPLVIVVVQLVLALRMHPLRSLTLVPRLRGPHGHVPGSGRVRGGKRKLTLQRGALALRACRRFLATDQGLEVVTAVLAGVFVDRYDDTRFGGFARGRGRNCPEPRAAATVLPQAGIRIPAGTTRRGRMSG